MEQTGQLANLAEVLFGAILLAVLLATLRHGKKVSALAGY